MNQLFPLFYLSYFDMIASRWEWDLIWTYTMTLDILSVKPPLGLLPWESSHLFSLLPLPLKYHWEMVISSSYLSHVCISTTWIKGTFMVSVTALTVVQIKILSRKLWSSRHLRAMQMDALVWKWTYLIFPPHIHYWLFF